jgi:hypothetical protein
MNRTDGPAFHIERDEEQLARDLTALYAVPVPTLAFTAGRPGAAASRRERFLRRHWRPIAGAAAAAVVAAALLIVPQTLGGGGVTPVSAQTIFDRASAAATLDAGTLPSFHLIATLQGADTDTASSEETWYGDAEHWRTEQSSVGDWSSFVQVRSGDDQWVAVTSGNGTRAVHGTTPSGATWNGGGKVAPASLAELLSKFSDDCESATLGGDAELLGRPVYVINVTMSPDVCSRSEDSAKLQANPKAALRLTIWVDQQTYITLRSEQSSVDGKSSFVYSVIAFDLGAEIDANRFTYAAPAGVGVIETEDWTQAKSLLAASPDSATQKDPQPASADAKGTATK